VSFVAGCVLCDVRRDVAFSTRLHEVLRVGFQFRRQYPIGPYFADFFCVSAKLAIELDGASHAGRERRERLRDTFFRKRGILVLRLSNDDALNRPAAALAQIRAALHRRSPLTQ
jgi:very-short-patch-repair endonuclease